MFGQSVLDKRFHANGVEFMVRRIEPYPREKVSERYKDVLNFQRGVLVAVSHRGTLIPNITLTGGVVRLLEIEIDNLGICKNPKAICEALGIKGAMYPYDISEC